MPNRFENGDVPPEALEPQQAARRIMSREDVIALLEKGEELEEVSLLDQDLSGLKLDGESFRRSDARGLKLFREKEEGQYEIAEIRNTDWTDADIADLSSPAIFCGVEAEGARFGFSETLSDRKARLAAEGKSPSWNDCGGYHNFVGNNGGFVKTRWLNIDFGGPSGYEAVFQGADFIDAVFEGCALSGLDLSEARLTGVKIINPHSIDGLIISERYAEDVASGLQLARAEDQEEFTRLVQEVGAKNALEKYLRVEVRAEN